MARVPTRALLLTLVVLSVALLPTPAAAADGWQWPLRGDVITAFRNGANPYAAGQHRGIDIAGAEGTPIVAAVGGEVRFAGPLGSSGVTVSVRTADGRFDTSYLHLASASVRKGARVDAGARLGAVGTTGRRSAVAPHLHFGVRDAGDKHAYRDPMDFLPPFALPPREAPRGVPAPVTVPRPVAVAPQPVRVPGRVRVPAARPIGAPHRRGLPAGRRVRVPVLGRVPHPVPHPVAVPVRPLVPIPSLRPVAQTRARGHGSESARAPQSGPAGQRLSAGSPAHAPGADTAPGPGAHRDEGGPDIGMALACLGLLLAAGCLGRPGTRDGGQGKRRAFDLAAWLRPLTGRR